MPLVFIPEAAAAPPPAPKGALEVCGRGVRRVGSLSWPEISKKEYEKESSSIPLIRVIRSYVYSTCHRWKGDQSRARAIDTPRASSAPVKHSRAAMDSVEDAVVVKKKRVERARERERLAERRSEKERTDAGWVSATWNSVKPQATCVQYVYVSCIYVRGRTHSDIHTHIHTFGPSDRAGRPRDGDHAGRRRRRIHRGERKE